VAWIVTAIAATIAHFALDSDNSGTTAAGCLVALAAFLAGLVGLASGIMGIILFVKWVWYS